MRAPWRLATRMVLCWVLVTALQASDATDGSDAPVAALPEVEPLSDVRDLSTAPRVFVKKIVLEGNSIFPEEELSRLFARYENREITSEELQEVRHRLSLLCLDRGYVNSGVVIPDQRVEDGSVVLRLVPGRLSGVDLSGNDRLKNGYITRRLTAGVSSPLNVNDLQSSLRLLQEDPTIDRIQAQLLPGAIPGDSRLRVVVTERRPLELVFGADNHRSPGIGGEQATLAFRHRDLTGHGDELGADLARTDGLTGGGFSYAIPVDPKDTTIRAYHSRGDSRIVEEPFDQIDIESEVRTTGLSVSRPLFRTPEKSVVGFAGLETRHSESTLLGVPFSFSPGDRDGESDVTVLHVGAAIVQRGSDGVLNLRAACRFGIDALDATINPSGPDGKFASALVQFQYGRRLGFRRSVLVARSALQVAFDPLLSLEKYPLGGATTVRGYRENRFVRDNALVVSGEVQIPMFPLRTEHPLDIRLAPFADYGRSWNDDPPSGEATEAIYGAGVGILWRPVAGLLAEVYWAHDFEGSTGGSGDLQDHGVHFRLAYRLPM